MPAGPDLNTLLALLPPATYIRTAEPMPAEQVPEPYRRLLVHEHHMTVTVEAHHGDLVNVQVLQRRQQGNTYARKILLALKETGKVVQFGLVRIHLQYCSPAVRTEILAQRTPLGRILIQHDVLRRIEPTEFLRVMPGPEMLRWFNLTTPHVTYGRLALIHCDGKPAIELLEIVAPEPMAPADS
jgi:chorismate-pyruvate lyase